LQNLTLGGAQLESMVLATSLRKMRPTLGAGNDITQS